MSPRTTRKILDFVIATATYVALASAGAGGWALLILPYGFWNYYDGATRGNLPKERNK